MSYYGSSDQLVQLLRQAQQAATESPAAHWKGSAVRGAANELAAALADRIHRVDPEPEAPKRATLSS